MIRLKRKNLFLLILFAVMVIPVSLHAESKTLQRVDDPVVMECRDFSALLGAPIDHLSLLAFRKGAWAPVPFQIDQKKPDGNYAFTMGQEASEDPDPNLDANDELVFMVKDTGDSAESGKDTRWPEGAEAVMEIEVTDPKSGQKGWLYLTRFSGEPPRSKEDYIRIEIDEAKGYRRVFTYEYVAGSPLGSVAVDYMAQTLPDGSQGVDTLDRLKMRGKLIFPGGITIPLNIDKMIKTEDKAYIDGPVRVLQLTDGYMKFLGFVKVRGTGYSTVSYYVNHNIFPVTVKPPKLPWFLKRLLPEFKLAAFLDFNSNVYGSHCFSAANPYNKEVVLDGRMSEAEGKLDTQTPVDWIAGIGPQGAIVSRLILSSEAAGIKKLTYYIDDDTINDPPEDHPGLAGVGYKLEGTGKYIPIITFQTIIYFKNDLEPEEIGTILDIIDHPVTVTVRQRKCCFKKGGYR